MAKSVDEFMSKPPADAVIELANKALDVVKGTQSGAPAAGSNASVAPNLEQLAQQLSAAPAQQDQSWISQLANTAQQTMSDAGLDGTIKQLALGAVAGGPMTLPGMVHTAGAGVTGGAAALAQDEMRRIKSMQPVAVNPQQPQDVVQDPALTPIPTGASVSTSVPGLIGLGKAGRALRDQSLAGIKGGPEDPNVVNQQLTAANADLQDSINFVQADMAAEQKKLYAVNQRANEISNAMTQADNNTRQQLETLNVITEHSFYEGTNEQMLADHKLATAEIRSGDPKALEDQARARERLRKAQSEDPQKAWDDLGHPLTVALSTFLAGFAAGFTGNNAALQMLERAVERNIEAQRSLAKTRVAGAESKLRVLEHINKTYADDFSRQSAMAALIYGNMARITDALGLETQSATLRQQQLLHVSNLKAKNYGDALQALNSAAQLEMHTAQYNASARAAAAKQGGAIPNGSTKFVAELAGIESGMNTMLTMLEQYRDNSGFDQKFGQTFGPDFATPKAAAYNEAIAYTASMLGKKINPDRMSDFDAKAAQGALIPKIGVGVSDVQAARTFASGIGLLTDAAKQRIATLQAAGADTSRAEMTVQLFERLAAELRTTGSVDRALAGENATMWRQVYAPEDVGFQKR